MVGFGHEGTNTDGCCACMGRGGGSCTTAVGGTPAWVPEAGKIGGRDGNGAPIPDPRWGFPPLGDANGAFLVPAGSLTGTFPSPSGEAGSGTFFASPSPFPVGDPD
jgi:hypothetical protein